MALDVKGFTSLDDDALMHVLETTFMADVENIAKTCIRLHLLCRQIRSVYLSELQKLGLRYHRPSAPCDITFGQALARLREKERRWRLLSPRSTSSPFDTIMDLAVPIFLSTDHVLYMYRESPFVETTIKSLNPRHTKHLFTFKSLEDPINLWAFDRLQNLLVIFQTADITGTTEGFRLIRGDSYIRILSANTLSNHALAASSLVPLRYDASMLSLPKIFGRWCGFSLRDNFTNATGFAILDWQSSGSFSFMHNFPPTDTLDFVFLSETLVLFVRDSGQNVLSLCVYRVYLTNKPNDTPTATLLATLSLPAMCPEAPQSCSIKPLCFQSNTAIIETPGSYELPVIYGGVFTINLNYLHANRYLTIVIDLGRLLAYVSRGPGPSNVTVPWREWATPISRVFLEPCRCVTRPFSDVVGYRLAFTELHDENPEDSFYKVGVMDFNPETVAWAVAEQTRGGSLPLTSSVQTQSDLYLPDGFFTEPCESSLSYYKSVLNEFRPYRDLCVDMTQDQIVVSAPDPLYTNGSHRVIYTFMESF